MITQASLAQRGGDLAPGSVPTTKLSVQWNGLDISQVIFLVLEGRSTGQVETRILWHFHKAL